MEKIDPYMMFLLTAAMAALAVHIGSNPVLGKKNRLCFVFAASALAACSFLEGFSYALKSLSVPALVLIISIAVEMIMLQAVLPLQSYAVNLKVFSRVMLIITVSYDIFVVAGICLGKMFFVDRDLNYVQGEYVVISIFFSLFSILAVLIVLFIVSRRFKSRGVGLLIMMVVVALLGAGISAVFFSDTVTLITYGLEFFLFYVYYSGMVQQELQSEVEQRNERIRAQSEAMIHALADAVDAKDRYTNGHSHRVAEYSMVLAKNLGWSEEDCRILGYEALMHDVGKIGIPDVVLNKAGRLTNVEFELIKSHTVLGSLIVPADEEFPSANIAARNHHERFDGRGYPDGLSGKDIPETARILALADSFDAMNSDRIYRPALPRDVIRSELLKGRGTQFDPDLTDVFVRIYDEGQLDKIGAEGRKDEHTDDDVTDFIRKSRGLLQLLTDESGAASGENGDGLELVQNYFSMLAALGTTDFEAHQIRVTPKEGIAVSAEEQARVMDILRKCVLETGGDRCAAGLLNPTSLILVYVAEDKDGDAGFMQKVLLYFYKIFDAAAFDISHCPLEED